MNRRTNIIKALRINWILVRNLERGLSAPSRAFYDLGIPLTDAKRLLTQPHARRPLVLSFKDDQG